ncbi:hypothetical protein EOB59_29955 [Mesorhizobium sp. M7A.F.Ca.MR.176.00.0.0]|uniref:hypothetical protein n=1 Tax=Mesorhizobium sp. M7A.F.Ca.MR.176.00.0.0 TaxID=2496776 RepID=UPI000FD36422|nr:hypothetical protein [Mesorhizobium sp. M7A.F.Ca.MR.176.00.0.0]RUU86108.1 hypothetical protein EOB59_29955 [Mesorhizobium sp. M7A.F.Ca.MR.176.00.0.0]
MTALMSLAEYARTIGVNASTISRAVSKGSLPVVLLSDGRRMIDREAADTARRLNGNISTGHGGKPDRTQRRLSAWKARREDGFDPAVKALLCVMRSDWPELARKAMQICGADELNQARAVVVLRAMTEIAGGSLHTMNNAARVWDFRTTLTPIPELSWSDDPTLRAFLEAYGDDEAGALWLSDDDAGVPGGAEWANEAGAACDNAAAFKR